MKKIKEKKIKCMHTPAHVELPNVKKARSMTPRPVKKRSFTPPPVIKKETTPTRCTFGESRSKYFPVTIGSRAFLKNSYSKSKSPD